MQTINLVYDRTNLVFLHFVTQISVLEQLFYSLFFFFPLYKPAPSNWSFHTIYMILAAASTKKERKKKEITTYLWLYSHQPLYWVQLAGQPFAFRTALILHGSDSTRCWKHSSDILVHIDMIASHSCYISDWDLLTVQ